MLKKVKTTCWLAIVFGFLTSSTALAENKLIVKDSMGAEKFVVTDTGKVGIGTSEPLTVLHMKGNTYEGTQIINQWAGTTSSGGGAFLGFHNNNAGALPNTNDRLGYLMFGSYFNNTVRLLGGGLTFKAENKWTSSSTPMYITFETAAPTSGRTERMRLTSTGNLGVGTTSPTQKLEINGGLRLNASAGKPACTSAARGTFWLTQGTTGVADRLEVCAKDQIDIYSWKVVF